ncbi:MAG: nuclear transport factor 2 family protein [Bacteroidota bacterium]
MEIQTSIPPITGQEALTESHSPYAALVQFYHAFNGRNLDLMAANWANTSDIAMDNPLGGIMHGWEHIKVIYDRIFNGPAEVYVEFYDYTIHEAQEMFYAVGRERGHFCIGDDRIELAIRTSRIFKWMNSAWRQVHHHGSIEDPALLKTYQTLVKS